MKPKLSSTLAEVLNLLPEDMQVALLKYVKSWVEIAAAPEPDRTLPPQLESLYDDLPDEIRERFGMAQQELLKQIVGLSHEMKVEFFRAIRVLCNTCINTGTQ